MPSDIFVVDNNSSDATVSIVESGFPEVEIVRLSENVGFGAANNIGIDLALKRGAEMIFLLNQDAWVERDCLSALCNCAHSNPHAAIVSPLHLKPGKRVLETGFDSYLKSEFRDSVNDALRDEKNVMPESIECSFVNAALWLLSRKCAETVGGFDPLFVHYGEDNDYCSRAMYHDFVIYVCPTAIGFHARNYENSETNFRTRQHAIWVAQLKMLKDVSHTFCYNLLMSYSVFLYNVFKNICCRRFHLARMYVLAMNRLSKSLVKIIKSRKKSRKPYAAFLKYNKDTLT